MVTAVSIEVLVERLDNVIRAQNGVRVQLDRIERDLRDGFVTRAEFERLVDSVVLKDGKYWLVEKFVFGLAAIVLTATITAILALVLR